MSSEHRRDFTLKLSLVAPSWKNLTSPEENTSNDKDAHPLQPQGLAATSAAVLLVHHVRPKVTSAVLIYRSSSSVSGSNK